MCGELVRFSLSNEKGQDAQDNFTQVEIEREDEELDWRQNEKILR